MTDQWTDRLSDYVDGELAPAERQALEAHLVGCAECRRAVDELRRVAARARALDDTPPAADLWPGVARRIGLTRAVPPAAWRVRRFAFSVPQLAAASVALALVSGGAVWLALRGPEGAPAGRPFPAQAPPGAARPAGWTEPTDAAVARLQEALEQDERVLDSATVRVVRRNLAIIDSAIVQARAALEADPGNAYLNLHLADTMRRKLELLRRVNAIAAAES